MNENRLCSLAIRQSGNTVEQPLHLSSSGAFLPDALRELFWIPENASSEPVKHKKKVWMKDLQIMICRTSEFEKEGMVVAAKGGHNGVPHNHNDIGQFILFNNGIPVIVDPGVETYRRETFNEKRYTNWFISSKGHNVPRVNGFLQEDGEEYSARDVVFNEAAGSFSMDLKNCYKTLSGLESLVREVIFKEEKREAVVKDAVICRGPVSSLLVPLCSPEKPEDVSGKLVWKRGETELTLSDNLRYTITEIELTDKKMTAVWGKVLYRIDLSAGVHKTTNRVDYSLRFNACID